MRAEIGDPIYSDDRLTVREQVMRVVEITTTLKAAARGQLRGKPKLKPAWTPPSPELWELAWSYKGRAAAEYRMYHSEPEGEPQLVGLRFHRKDLSDETLIGQRQEHEMRTAGKRHVDGERVRWGHRVKSCDACLEL